MNTFTSLAAEGCDYAAALLAHNIDPFRALRLMDSNQERQALQSYIDSLLPPPVPGAKSPKLDKVAAQILRCRQTARTIKNVRFV